MAPQTAQSRHHHSHLLLFSEESWAFFFLPALAGLPPPVFHSPHTHWQPIHSLPHTATLTPNTRMGFWKDPLSSDRENHLIWSLKSRKLCLFWFWLSLPLCAVWFDNSMTGSLPTIDLLEQRDAGKRCGDALWQSRRRAACETQLIPVWELSTHDSVQWLRFRCLSDFSSKESAYSNVFLYLVLRRSSWLFFILSGLWPKKPIIEEKIY